MDSPAHTNPKSIDLLHLPACSVHHFVFDWDFSEMVSTALTNAPRTVTWPEMLRAMREIELLQKQTDWMLVAPNGQMWKGKPDEVMSILAAHHPLMKAGN
jgi:hypothetical protein